MTTTLESSFLRIVALKSGFTPKPMLAAQSALLMIGLKAQEFSAFDIPRDVTNGDKHLAGCATGSLVATGLITVIGRMKSPDKSAKGRKLDVLRLTNREKAKTWLRANGIELDATFEPQQELIPAYTAYPDAVAYVATAAPLPVRDKMSEHWPATYRGRVPVNVRMACDLGPDSFGIYKFLHPAGTPQIWVHKDDEVPVTCSQHGAMSLVTPYGNLGVKPHECDIIEWREARV